MNIPENLDRWMFDYMEGNLAPHEVQELEQFLLQNPGFEPDAEAWNNAVIANEPVAYPNQQHLQRSNKFAGWYGRSAAALLLLLVGIAGYLFITDNPTNPILANHTNSFKSDRNGEGLIASFENTFTNGEDLQNRISQEGEIMNTDLTNSGATNSNYNNRLLAQSNNYIANQVGAFNNNTSNSLTSGINNGTQQNNNSFLNQPVTDFNSEVLSNERMIGKEEEISESGSVINLALMQEQAKYHSDAHASKYKNNPEQDDIAIDLSRNNNIHLNSFGSKTKRFYRKIEKMLTYPVALANLRDPEVLLPENSLLGSNPGFAGGMLKSRFVMNYRNQWQGTEMNAQKVRISYDNYFSEIRGGFGLTMNSTTYGNGAFGDYSIDLNYSPKISLSKNVVLEPGVKVSLGILTANSGKLINSELFEAERGLLLKNTLDTNMLKTDKLWYKDYGLGLVLNTKWFYTGISADNLSNHYAHVYRVNTEVEPVKTPVLFNAIIGLDYISTNKRMTLSPYLTARKFGEQQEAWIGMNFKFNHFMIGGSYSTNNDYTAAMGMKFKKFKLVYQFDKTSTLITNEQFGSHNIGIRFTGESKNKRIK